MENKFYGLDLIRGVPTPLGAFRKKRDDLQVGGLRAITNAASASSQGASPGDSESATAVDSAAAGTYDHNTALGGLAATIDVDVERRTQVQKRRYFSGLADMLLNAMRGGCDVTYALSLRKKKFLRVKSSSSSG